jgi:hypothetical protein
MPDGTYVEMPEKASPELLSSLSGKGGFLEGLKDFGRAAHSAVTGAATGLGGMLGDAAVEGADLAGQLFAGTPKGSFKPQIAPSEALKTLTGGTLVDKPKTTAGKYAATIGEGALGTLLSPGSAVKNAIIGGSSGGGSEAAASLFGDNMVTRLLGGLAGGGVAGLATAPKTNAGEMAKSALQGVDDVELQLAKDRMVEAVKNGRQINVSQAMGRDSNLDKLVDVLSNSKEGVKTVDLLRNQPAHAVDAVGKFQNQLPGAIRPETAMANQVQSAATNRIDDLKRQRTKLWEDTLANSGSGGALPIPAAIDAIKDLGQRAAKYPNTKQAAWLDGLRGKLVDDVGMPLTDPKQINQILKEAANDLKPQGLQASGIDIGTAKYLGGVIDDMRASYGAAFKPIRDANSSYKGFTENTLNPVREGPIGTLAGVSGSIEGKAAAKGKLEAIFNKGSNEDASGVSDILTVARQLKASGEGSTFLDGAKTWLSNKVQDSIKTVGERGNDDVAAVLHKAFFETGKQKQGFRDTMAGVADIHGVPPKSLVDGAEQFFNYLGQLSRRPSSVGGIGGQDFRRLAEDSLFGKLGQVSVVTPLRQPVLKYVDWLRSNSYKAMDDLVNTPEGIDMLQKLAKSSTIGPAQATAMATFLSTANQMDNVQVPKE